MIRCLLLILVAASALVACSDDEPIATEPVGKTPAPRKDPVVAPPVVPADPPSVAKDAGNPPAVKKAVRESDAAREAGRRVTRLLDQLSVDDNGKRFSAAVELGKLGDDGCVDALVNVLKGDEDYFVRRAAARSLGELGSERAVPALIEALGDKEVFVTLSAKKALTVLTGRKFETAAEWSDWWAQQGR